MQSRSADGKPYAISVLENLAFTSSSTTEVACYLTLPLSASGIRHAALTYALRAFARDREEASQLQHSLPAGQHTGGYF